MMNQTVTCTERMRDKNIWLIGWFIPYEIRRAMQFIEYNAADSMNMVRIIL